MIFCCSVQMLVSLVESLADWWTRFQTVDTDAQEALMDERHGLGSRGAPKKRRTSSLHQHPRWMWVSLAIVKGVAVSEFIENTLPSAHSQRETRHLFTQQPEHLFADLRRYYEYRDYPYMGLVAICPTHFSKSVPRFMNFLCYPDSFGHSLQFIPLTPHMGPPGFPDDINAVAGLETSLTVEVLLQELQQLEQQHQRVRIMH